MLASDIIESRIERIAARRWLVYHVRADGQIEAPAYGALKYVANRTPVGIAVLGCDCLTYPSRKAAQAVLDEAREMRELTRIGIDEGE